MERSLVKSPSSGGLSATSAAAQFCDLGHLTIPRFLFPSLICMMRGCNLVVITVFSLSNILYLQGATVPVTLSGMEFEDGPASGLTQESLLT